MSDVIERAPELDRLLDGLEDFRGRYFAKVWIAGCDGGVKVVPINERIKVDFGKWQGPAIEEQLVMVQASYRGQHAQRPISESRRDQGGERGDDGLVLPGMRLTLTVTIDVGGDA